MKTSALLVRPMPISGESSSSWRQRVAWANGFRLFPVSDERTRRADPDIGYDDRDFEWIAALHGSTTQIARSMTFRAFVGVIGDRVGPRSHPQWWLRARYGPDSRNYGPMFCPHCLSSDEIPHFRLAWRFGFNTVCLQHRCLLLDQCPQCTKAPWPSGCGVGLGIHSGFQSLLFCWHCGTDLSSFPTVQASYVVEPYDMLSPPIPNSSLKEFSTADVLNGIRSICQLFLRNRATKVIAQSATEWSVVCAQINDGRQLGFAVEYLNVATRHLLIQSALKIISDWPNSFLKFASDSGISRTHFNSVLYMAPPWMSRLIDAHLAKQNRNVTLENLEAAYQTLVLQLGRHPTRAEVRKHLGWQGRTGLDAVFRKFTPL